MWNVVRTLLIALAVAGFIGQTTAHATPIQVFENASMAGMMDCPDRMDIAGDAKSSLPDCCKDMTADCIGKMGCATFAAPMPPETLIPRPVARGSIAYLRVSVSRVGAGPDPLHFPPKPQA